MSDHDPEERREFLATIRDAEKHRTVRAGYICGTIVIGLISLPYCVQILCRASLPLWPIYVIAALLGFPVVVAVPILMAYRRDCLKEGRRTAMLEAAIDADRTSSGPPKL